MSDKLKKSAVAREDNDPSDALSEADTALSILGNGSSMASGQRAMSASLSNGRSMQNAVAQAQTAQSIFHAQTTTGVTSLLKRRAIHKRRMSRLRYFKEFTRKAL